jgi:hypothetical protein
MIYYIMLTFVHLWHTDIFWGGNTTQCVNIFKLQKRIIRIIMGAITKDSFWEFFRTLQIIPLDSQYILSIALFMIRNKDLFIINLELHKFSTEVTLISSNQWLTSKYVRKGPAPEIRKLSDYVELCKKVLRKFYYNILFICWMNILLWHHLTFDHRNVY